MTRNSPDERLVYLALKNTFDGAEAQVRRPKKIRELILKRQHATDIGSLIREHNIDNVCNVAKTLLEQQIFESTLKAKIRFPEVFEVSPAQSAERSASEAEAARTEADAIKVAVEGQSNNRLPEPSHDAPLSDDEKQSSSLRDITTQSRKHPFPYATVHVPSLYPVYLPYHAQHQLLVTVQGILEQACYGFGVQQLQETLEHEGWDCAEAAELNKWSRVLRSHEDKFSQADLQELGKPFPDVLDSISHLRHTAVHRLRISANRLEQFMVDAEALVRLLRDNDRVQKLSRIRVETQLTLGELKRTKDLLESKLTSKLKNIAAQRAQLDKLEQMAINEMLREDKECQISTGDNLNQSIGSPDTVVQSETSTDADTKSEADLDEDLVPVSGSDQDVDMMRRSCTKGSRS